MKLAISSSYPEQSVTQIARRTDRHSLHVYGHPNTTKRSTSSRSLYSGVTRRGFTLLGLGKAADHFMYRDKVTHDRATAGELKPSDVIIGMWGSSLETFRRAGNDSLKVLNFVNAHPDHHNEVLSGLGLQRKDREMVPEWFAKRVREEVHLADLLLVPSHIVANDLNMRGVPAAKIFVLPYAVDKHRFSPRTANTMSGGRFSILYVGQISERKGLRLLFQALTEVELDADVVLVGPVVSRAVAEAAPNNAHRLATLPQDKLSGLYQQASCFVLPSHEDTFGLVATEAMACGAFPVVSSAAGVSEIIAASQVGLVFNSGDHTALCEALLTAEATYRDPRITKSLASWRQTTPDWNSYCSKLAQRLGTEASLQLERPLQTVQGK